MEFKGIDLGDKRLNQRAILLAEQLSGNPAASIPQACGGWAETAAAHRFFAQDKLEWTDVMEPHWQCSAERMRACDVVLCLDDTTELNFNGQDIAGLGPLSYEAQRGMYVHATYAVTPQREPLGVLNAWMWARERKGADGVRGGGKESTRWIEGYERVAEQAADLPGTQLVYVADRVSDIIALMRRAHDLGCPADWLIRAQHNRVLPEGQRLWDHATQAEPLGEIRFTLPGRQRQKAREVHQQIWSRRIDLPGALGGVVSISCLVAREIDAPAGVTPIRMALADQSRRAGSGRGCAADRLVSCPLGGGCVQVRTRYPVGESPTEAKDSSLVAWEASWRESKMTEPSDSMLRKEYMQRTRLQRAVNADVASSHETPVAETVYNARKQQDLSETSPMRQISPAGYQRRHGVKDNVETGEALGIRRRNPVEEMSAITVSGKCGHRCQGDGSGCSTVDGRASKRARREGPGPVSTPSNNVRQG